MSQHKLDQATEARKHLEQYCDRELTQIIIERILR